MVRGVETPQECGAAGVTASRFTATRPGSSPHLEPLLHTDVNGVNTTYPHNSATDAPAEANTVGVCVESIRSHNVSTMLFGNRRGAVTIFGSGGTWSHRVAVVVDR